MTVVFIRTQHFTKIWAEKIEYMKTQEKTVNYKPRYRVGFF